jgi:electron transfer flavoprotein beta subunit
MKILVCIKQVVDPESPLVIGADGNWIDEKQKITLRMNSYDDYALEEALLLAERFPDTVVDAVTVGPARSRPVVVKALEKGARNGFLLAADAVPLGAFGTASALADFAKGRDYDCIMCGVISEDLMQGMTGPALAALLGVPCAVAVMRAEFDPQGRSVEVECELEGGLREGIRLSMPCLLAIQSGINRPRYPSLSNVLRAKTAEIVVMEACIPASGGLGARPVLEYPERGQKGIVIQGSPGEKAGALAGIFHEKALL